MLYGTASGLTPKGDQFWNQDSAGIKGASHGSKYDGSAERFGAVLASGDFDRDGRADLAIGVPGDRVGADEAWAGGVNVLYGSKHGLAARGNQHWTQARLPGTPQDGDRLLGAMPWPRPTSMATATGTSPSGRPRTRPSRATSGA